MRHLPLYMVMLLSTTVLYGCSTVATSATDITPQVYIEENQETGQLVPVLPYLISSTTDTFLLGNIETVAPDMTHGTVSVTYVDLDDITGDPVKKTTTFHMDDVVLVTPFGKCHITNTYFWCPDRAHPVPTF